MLKKFFRQLSAINLMIEPTIRSMYVRTRAHYYIRLRKRLKTINSDDAFKTTVMHNVNGLMGVNNRMNLLIFPLAIIETITKDARILVIGPRNENDIFTLVGYGFKKSQITGLDLISYSPLILLGDMHAIPFEDNHFDVVVCGWTLSYSAEPQKAIDEMLRVLKPKGILSIGVEYSVMTPEEVAMLTKTAYSIQETDRLPERVNSTDALKALIGKRLGDVFFCHDAPNKISHSGKGLVNNVSNVALVARIEKI